MGENDSIFFGLISGFTFIKETCLTEQNILYDDKKLHNKTKRVTMGFSLSSCRAALKALLENFVTVTE